MTADQLQSIVLRLANMAPTRYWLHLNYPCQEPWLMAVKVDLGWRYRDENQLGDHMRDLGFTWDFHERLWTVERTNADGTPYRSTLL